MLLRHTWRLRLLEDVWRDAFYSIRQLRRRPAFTIAVVLTLALAIGANASIFAVVERVVLNPLPYPDSDRLIELDHGSQRLNIPARLWDDARPLLISTRSARGRWNAWRSI